MFEMSDEDQRSIPSTPFSPFSLKTRKSHFSLQQQPAAVTVVTPPTQFKDTDIQNLLTNLVSQGCSQQSRVVQQFVTKLAEQQKTDIIDAAVTQNIQFLGQLITDKYGNYLMQLLIKHSSADVFKSIIGLVENDIKTFSFNSFSCRVVQAVTERCILLQIDDFVIKVFNELISDKNQAILTLNSQYASHIILLTLNYLDYEQQQKMFQFINDSYLKIAENQYGCRILEKIYVLVDSENAASYVQLLFEQIEKNCVRLSDNLYGNYLVQAVLKNEFYQENGYISNIMQLLIDQFTYLCKSKYGSNICEKVVGLCDIQLLVNLIAKCDFEELIQDQFGNFVTQMFIKRFSDFSKQCPCKKCNPDQEIESIEEIERDENGNQIVVQKEYICILDLFKAFCGYIKQVLEAVPSNHVQNCINESLDFDNLEEVDFEDFLKLVQ